MILTTIAGSIMDEPSKHQHELAQYAGKAWYQNPYQLTDFILMTTVGS